MFKESRAKQGTFKMQSHNDKIDFQNLETPGTKSCTIKGLKVSLCVNAQRGKVAGY